MEVLWPAFKCTPGIRAVFLIQLRKEFFRHTDHIGVEEELLVIAGEQFQWYHFLERCGKPDLFLYLSFQSFKCALCVFVSAAHQTPHAASALVVALQEQESLGVHCIEQGAGAYDVVLHDVIL